MGRYIGVAVRIIFLSFVLSFANAPLVLALNHVSDDQIKAIQNQIFIGNRMDKQIVEAADDLADAKDAGASDAEIIKRERLLSRAKDKQNAARTKAIHMAISAYGIEPASWTGVSVVPATKGRTIRWMPLAREYEPHVVRDAKGRESIVKRDKKDNVGTTYVDGVTIMDATAFIHGPGYLASYLLHERIHFEQITSNDAVNAKSYAELQEEAYAAQVDNSSYFFNAAKDEDRILMGRIEDLFFTEKALVKQEEDAHKGVLGLIRRILPRPKAPDFFDATIHTNGELSDIKAIVAKARAQAEIGHRETLKRKAAAKEAADQASHREHDRRLRETIINLTRRSCDSPGSVSQTELAVLAHPFQNPWNFRWMDPLRPRDFPGREHCSDVFVYLAEGGRDFEKLRQVASPSQIPSSVATPVQQEPQLIPIAPTKHPFSRVLPQYKSYAENACHFPAQIQWNSILFPAYDYSYREYDDKLIRELKNGMSDCAQKLLDYLVEIKRRSNGDTDALQPHAIRQQVAAYTPVYSPPGRGSPRQEEPGCEYDANIGGRICPKSH